MREVAEAVGGIDAALANHLVMGPAILARADVGPFAAKIHGSALEYTVKPTPALLALRARKAWKPPPASSSAPATRPSRSGRRCRMSRPAERRPGSAPRASTRSVPAAPERAPADGAGGGPCGRTPAPAWTAAATGPADRAARGSSSSGKLIVSKGVDLLLAAWPLVRSAHPDARLQIAGFGEYEDGLAEVAGGAGAGRSRRCARGRAARRGLEGGEEKPLPILSAFLADPPAGYVEAAKAAAGSVEFIGRLEHDEVAELLPRAEALVMPSTFPEAFGMVAAEAAACGALPVSAGHSGMLEVSRQLAAALPPRSAA